MSTQTAKDKVWKDAKGIEVPYTRITARERLQEKNAQVVFAAALKVEQQLKDLKQLVLFAHGQVLTALKAAEGVDVKETKGNKVWYNFDRSICIECDVQDRITFDDLLIAAAREKLNAFLKAAVKSEVEFVTELVTGAFETTNGKLDSKKVMGLLGYANRIKHVEFQEAMDMIQRSIQRSTSKNYMRVGTLQEDGSYRFVQLNFSAI
ncbi:MAG: DUF3164 family protein [Flavobacteriales bacterium]